MILTACRHIIRIFAVRGAAGGGWTCGGTSSTTRRRTWPCAGTATTRARGGGADDPPHCGLKASITTRPKALATPDGLLQSSRTALAVETTPTAATTAGAAAAVEAVAGADTRLRRRYGLQPPRAPTRPWPPSDALRLALAAPCHGAGTSGHGDSRVRGL